MRESLRKAGQRVMVGFEGQAASSDVRRLVRDYGAASAILFARNVDSPEQVAELVRELQAIAREAGHDRPLLVAVDQEGGRVARLRSPWTEWPPLRALGRLGSEEHARRMGAALGEELKACGVGCDFAPVVDVDTNPRNPVIGDRSFGGDPDLVGRLGAALIRGLQGAGVVACAKHFPGHGDTDVDSHLALPAVDHSRARLEDVELRPFRMAIEADVACIMTAHVLVRDLDDRLPATLSPAVLGLLRKEMRFDGVVVSDDLEMKAVADRWRPGPAAVLAAKAGCDLIPVCRDPHAQVEAIEALVRAVEGEDVSWKAMDEACGRIRRVKERYLLPYRDPVPKEARLAAGTGERLALAQEIAGRSGVRVS
ncbi:MAG TPA: beta-N-acetylhexosaminidase [Vicinamibacteria bacterium]|nr:beta-N-acetylhexosaminidase [Vicinamibacteria bacterium]